MPTPFIVQAAQLAPVVPQAGGSFIVSPALGSKPLSVRASKNVSQRDLHPELARHRGTVVEMLPYGQVLIEATSGGHRYTCTLSQMRKPFKVLLQCPGRIVPAKRESGLILYYFHPSLGSKDNPNPFLIVHENNGYTQPFGDTYIELPFGKGEVLLTGSCPIAPGSRGPSFERERLTRIQSLVEPNSVLNKRIEEMGMTKEEYDLISKDVSGE